VKKGLLIVFEGIEGSGKSTQINFLAHYLARQGYKVVKTREPGGTTIGDAIRGVLLDPAFKDMSAWTEFLLYSASRAQHVQSVIRPALERGEIVLTDRYAESSLAYQGYGRGLDLDRLMEISRDATGGIESDIVILLDLPVPKGIRRATRSGADRLEQESEEFHQKVRQGYLALKKQYPDKFFIVDATQDRGTIHAQVVEIVKKFLPELR